VCQDFFRELAEFIRLQTANFVAGDRDYILLSIEWCFRDAIQQRPKVSTHYLCRQLTGVWVTRGQTGAIVAAFVLLGVSTEA